MFRTTIATVALATLCLAATGAQAFDESKYPNLKGQWLRVPVPGVFGQPGYDPSKRGGPLQDAPLTVEYKKIFEDNLKDQALGGQGIDPTYTCLSPGMPRVMIFGPVEFVVTPETTHIFIEHIHDNRRIHTDGRPWPGKDAEPTFVGTSIGKWIDTDGDGKYDLLEVETRNLRGPRTFDYSGLPLSFDNDTLVKERYYLDKSNPNILVVEMTTADGALTRPWSIVRKWSRVKTVEQQPVWREENCTEGNGHVEIAKQGYFLSADGLLMPTRKDQAPPDLRYFDPPRK
jgi:hypothetical protein